MKSVPFISVLILTFLLFTACNSKKAQSIDSQELGITEPFDITYSEGGGLTGMVDTFHLNSSGAVEHFRSLPGQQDSLISSKNVPTTELAKLQQSLLASTILNEQLDKKGNMTTKLTYATADTAYSFSWPGAGATSEMSQDLKKWLAQLKIILQ